MVRLTLLSKDKTVHHVRIPAVRATTTPCAAGKTSIGDAFPHASIETGSLDLAARETGWAGSRVLPFATLPLNPLGDHS